MASAQIETLQLPFKAKNQTVGGGREDILRLRFFDAINF
jgi:hypothetical protein